MEQAKWYYILIRFGGKPKQKFHYKVFKYLINQIVKRSVNEYASVWFNNKGDKDIYTVYKFKVFCGKKKLKKLIEEAHLLGLEDELLIFERKGETK